MRSIPHLPALDGLRGLALLSVLLFHSKKALPGGYLGVDLFFVISGYLITSLLLAEHRSSGGIRLSAFWTRRARRLLPALFALVLACALYCRFVAQPDELARVRGDTFATLGYVANWRAVFSRHSYWDLFAAPSPLEHMWSLAIEEQFYLVWPVLVKLLLEQKVAESPQHRERRVLTLSLVGLVISGAVALALITLHPQETSRVYFGTDTRAPAILAGAVLAALLPPAAAASAGSRIARSLDVLGVLAAILLGAAWWKLDGQNPLLYRGGFWLTELAAVVLIACAVLGPSRSFVARALAWRPLVLVGIISYGLYLWHWPVNVLLTPERLGIADGWCRLLQPVLTFAIATASYHLLERTIRVRGLPFGRPVYVVPAAAAFTVLAVLAATARARPRGEESWPTREDAALARGPSPEKGPATDAGARDAEGTFKIAVLGDSTANSIGWTLRGVRRPGVSVALLGKDGCSMLLQNGCGSERWTAELEEVRPNATLFLVGGAFMFEMDVHGMPPLHPCQPAWDTRFEAALAKSFAELVAFEPKTRVYALTSPAPLGSFWGGAEHGAQIACINRTIRRAASRAPGVAILDLAEHLCPEHECVLREAGMTTPIRPDGIHFHMEGANALSAWVLDRVTGS